MGPGDDMMTYGFSLWRKTYWPEVEIGTLQSPLRYRQHRIARNLNTINEALTKKEWP
jgi:hypothetical protein